MGKTAELRKKGEGEWKMVEDKARAKLTEIKTERERQIEERILGLQKKYPQSPSSAQKAKEDFEKQIQDEFTDIDEGIQKAMHKEKEYERCDYRRTHCQALQDLICLHNSCRVGMKSDSSGYMFINEGIEADTDARYQRLKSIGGFSDGYKESSNCTKYLFNQYGDVEYERKFLVDPDRFWNYDLMRSKIYSERPL